MKKTRKAHLWIGLIASIFIFMESITGLLMNEPWLIGQSQMEGGKWDFQGGQYPGAMNNSGSDQSGQFNGQTQGNSSFNQGQTNGQANGQINGQTQDGSVSGSTPSQFPGGMGRMGSGNGSSGSFMSIVRGLHEGRIGTNNIKWLIDLVAIAMIILTGTGIYLSSKVLAADRKRKNRDRLMTA